MTIPKRLRPLWGLLPRRRDERGIAAPEFVVLAGRDEIGSVGDDVVLADAGGAARVLLLAGRAWLVTYIHWKRRCCFVEPTDLPGRARRGGLAGGMSFEITRGM